MGWWSARREQREEKLQAQRLHEEHLRQLERERIDAEQARLRDVLGPEERVFALLEGRYWDAEPYIEKVVDRPEGIFNFWGSRYLEKGPGNLVLTGRRIMFTPADGGPVIGGAFINSPRNRSAPVHGSLEWISLNPTFTPDVPEDHCFLVCFDGRSLPKYDRFGYFATNSPRVKDFAQAVADAARRARSGL